MLPFHKLLPLLMDFEQLTTTHSVYHLQAPHVLLILLTLSTQIILSS